MKTLFGENISTLVASMVLWQYWKNSICFRHKNHMGLVATKLSSGVGKHTGADNPCRLISTYVIQLLESIIPKLASNASSIF